MREAAEQVAGASPSETLAALIDECLIQRQAFGPLATCRRLLRQFGEQKLAEQPDEEAQTYERFSAYSKPRLSRRQMERFNAGQGDKDLVRNRRRAGKSSGRLVLGENHTPNHASVRSTGNRGRPPAAPGGPSRIRRVGYGVTRCRKTSLSAILETHKRGCVPQYSRAH